MANRTKLTREVIKKVAEGIYPAGNYFEVACQLAGISKSIGYAWLEMARGDKPRAKTIPKALLLEFLDAVERANAEAENAAVVYWRSAFPTDWRASAEYLSRRWPERWKKIDRNEITGADGAPLFVGFGEDMNKL